MSKRTQAQVIDETVLLNMMTNRSEWDDLTGGVIGSSEIEYCGRCGKPKQYIGDYWGQEPPPWCTCPPIEKYTSGQFVLQGWECPKCNRVYAPGVEECLNCRPVDTEPILA